MFYVEFIISYWCKKETSIRRDPELQNSSYSEPQGTLNPKHQSVIKPAALYPEVRNLKSRNDATTIPH